ncbi:Ig-like domain-containing protein [Acinetobacter indicus]|uniref:Ig-like domain-containing protein n=1 Tax=Acinetobacter indicus TaxID=756892 RepID=UPI00257788AB|nr:Ig-like domain-containing protein [Acinetobacter indicus]
MIGTAVAGTDGTYSVTLDKVYNNGEKLEVIATDTANNSTTPNSIIAPDKTAPASLTQAISADGQTITGTTEAGATVTATFNGQVVGTAVAGTDGQYTLTLNPAFTNGEQLAVIATDKANNSTKPNTVTAPDSTAPVTLTQVLSADNKTVTGTTEANATVTVSYNGKVIGTAVAGTDGTYSVTLDKVYNNGEKLEIIAKDQADNAVTKNLYAPIAQLENADAHFELAEIFETQTVLKDDIVYSQQDQSSMYIYVDVEVTGENASIILSLTNASGSINGSYKYSIYGNGASSSSSKIISSIGLSYQDIILTDGLAPGHYTLQLDASSWNTDFKLVVKQEKLVNELVFEGYEPLVGHIFADVNGQVSAPQSYILKVGDQEIRIENGKGNVESITYQTEHGYLILNADGSYTYQSGWNESGLDAKGLNDQLNIEIISMDGQSQSDYQVYITTDITPPTAGELNFTDFDDNGISNIDGITNDSSFDLGIQGNELNSSVEYQYSTDGGVTWTKFDYRGEGFNFNEGTYSFRAKVTDFVGNESYTDIKTITVDLTAPELQSVFSYDAQNDQVIFNAPKDAYEVYKWVNDEWQAVKLNHTLGWNLAKYKVVATDVAGNTAEKIFNIGEVSGTYKPDSSSDENIIIGTEANDYLYGGDRDDILIASGGADTLNGGNGNDTLIVQAGSSPYSSTVLFGDYGTDEYIIDKKYLTSGVLIGEYRLEGDILRLKGYSQDELLLQVDNKSLKISFINSSGSVLIFDQFEKNSGISFIELDDGTVWDREIILANTKGQLFGTENSDELSADEDISVVYGLNGNDRIIGGVHNDYLYGGDGDDILIASGGADTLNGGNGNDTLIVQAGSSPYSSTVLFGDYGTDEYIIDKKYLTSGVLIGEYRLEGDILRLKGYSQDELLLQVDNKSLKISFINSSGSVLIFDQFEKNSGISFIELDDGTVWDRETILNKVNAPQPALFSIGEESLLDVLSVEDTELFDHSADGMLLNENPVASLLIESEHNEIDLSPFVDDVTTTTVSASGTDADTLVSNYRVDVYDDLLMPNTMSI